MKLMELKDLESRAWRRCKPKRLGSCMMCRVPAAHPGLRLWKGPITDVLTSRCGNSDGFESKSSENNVLIEYRQMLCASRSNSTNVWHEWFNSLVSLTEGKPQLGHARTFVWNQSPTKPNWNSLIFSTRSKNLSSFPEPFFQHVKDCFLRIPKHEGHKQQRTARRIDNIRFLSPKFTLEYSEKHKILGCVACGACLVVTASRPDARDLNLHGWFDDVTSQ